jgi:hypothetical protein
VWRSPQDCKHPILGATSRQVIQGRIERRSILKEYGFLTLAQVYAALADYHANRDEIEAYLAADEDEYNRLISSQVVS